MLKALSEVNNTTHYPYLYRISTFVTACTCFTRKTKTQAQAVNCVKKSKNCDLGAAFFRTNMTFIPGYEFISVHFCIWLCILSLIMISEQ